MDAMHLGALQFNYTCGIYIYIYSYICRYAVYIDVYVHIAHIPRVYICIRCILIYIYIYSWYYAIYVFSCVYISQYDSSHHRSLRVRASCFSIHLGLRNVHMIGSKHRTIAVICALQVPNSTRLLTLKCEEAKPILSTMQLL